MIYIDLFDKGKGLEYLKSVYHLSKQTVFRLKKYLYVHNEMKQTPEETENEMISGLDWLSAENTQGIKRIIMTSTLPSWETVDYAAEKFLSLTGVKIDKLDLSDLRFRCIHVSPTIDNGESIKKHGLRKLVDLLETESPIKKFLAEYGIEVKPSERWLSINGNKESIDGTELAIKLYETNSRIEAFIVGDLKTLKDYSNIESNPEFLHELSPLCGMDLETEWEKRKNSLLYVSFDVSLDECTNFMNMETALNTPDNYQRLLPYLCEKKEYGKESKNVWRNYWFINACIDNSCPGAKMDRDPIAIKDDITIDSRRIRVLSAEDFQ